MDMKNVDYELAYEPGKDENDPLDFLSRHPLPIRETNNTEKIIKNIIESEYAIVLKQIRSETEKDEQLQRLQQRILAEDWEFHRKDIETIPFYHIRHKLFIMERLILWGNQMIIPRRPYCKIVKAAHSLGHLGMT